MLGWQPRHDNLDFIVRTALEWERTLLRQQEAAG
jgi:UDP-glucose 4-epimerase